MIASYQERMVRIILTGLTLIASYQERMVRIILVRHINWSNYATLIASYQERMVRIILTGLTIDSQLSRENG